MLEAAPEDIVVSGDGGLGVAGVPSKSLGWAELARTASERGEPLLVQHDTERSGATFPFGAHLSRGGGRHRDRAGRADRSISPSTTAG